MPFVASVLFVDIVAAFAVERNHSDIDRGERFTSDVIDRLMEET